MKTAGELVVYAAARHFFQRSLGNGQQLFVLGLLIALQEEINGRRMGKLGSVPKTAVAAIKQFGDGLNLRADDGQVKTGMRAREHFRLRHGIGQRIGSFLQVRAFVVEGIGNGHQHTAKSWAAALIFRREIGAAVERLAIGQQKSREGPAPLAGKRADRRLIARIDIRTLVAIDFYGDKMLVDDPGDFRIFVAFAVDDVAPVAPHRANIQEHRLVFGLRESESGVAPLMPVDRLMCGGTQVRAGGVFETILCF